MNSPFQHVALIGLGLIAGSIALAQRRADPSVRVTGYARSAATRDTAREIGLCEVHDTVAETIRGADLVILCVPVGAMGAVMADIAPHLTPGTLVSDVGSVKRAVYEAVMPHLPDGVDFVGAHPMAGTEHSGPLSGFESLYDKKWCLIVPHDGQDDAKSDKLAAFWQALGSSTQTMDPDHHDLVCAVVSHAPHLIAYTMVGVADDLRRVTDSEVIKFSAAGFRDFSRIAASDPTMWRDVFLTNKDATLEILGRFTEELFALQRAIRTGDGEHLFDYFTRTRAIRRGIIEAGQDTDAPNFGRSK